VAPAPTRLGLYETRGSPYLGRYPDKRLAGVRYLDTAINCDRPLEDPENGCPGAWYRTRYIDSVDRYTRRRTASGGRVSNPLFDTADWQIQAAVLRLEGEQERWHSDIDRQSHERAEARRKADEAKHTRGRGRRR